jgi:hypothetical protein
MEASAHDLVDAGQPSAEPSDRIPTWLECLGGVIVSPLKTFEYLASNPQWLLPLVIVILWVLVDSVIEVATMFFTFFSESPGEMEGLSAELLQLLSFAFGIGMWSVSQVAESLIALMAMAGVLYASARAFGIRPRFYPLIAALAYAEFVPRLVGESLGCFVQLLTGKIAIYSQSLPTNIAPLFGVFHLPYPVYVGLKRIELFHLWSFALVAITVRFVLKTTSERALLITVLYWIVCSLGVVGWTALWLYFL